MEDITITVDAQHASVLRQEIALRSSSVGERLDHVADDYLSDPKCLPALREAVEEMRVLGGLLEALGWDPANDRAGESRTLVAPREQLQSLLVEGWEVSVEQLDHHVSGAHQGPERPSVIVHRKAKELELFEGLLDRVGWPDQEGGG